MFKKSLMSLALAAAALQLGVSQPAAAAINSMVVATEAGQVQGFTKRVLGTTRNVDVFLGVPYARPPVGDLRFAAPQRHPGWKGLRDASIMPPVCRQKSGGSEDCLYLNIYRPSSKETSLKMPVIFYVHGGANVRGGASGVDGSRLANYMNVVVVTVQHRLGAFGFLSMPQMRQQEAGNLAILDLQEALMWVRRNITKFGGNPDNITLAGQSSGATNATRLLVESKAKGLFHGVILQSDDGLHDVDTPDQSRSRSMDFAKELGCAAAENPLKCLRALPEAKIEQASRKIGIWNPASATSAVSEIAKGQWNAVPVLMGANSDEGRGAGRAFIGADAGQYAAWLKGLVGEKNAASVMMRYPSYKYTSKHAIPYVMGEVITDSGMRGLGGCTELALARAFVKGKAPAVWVYEFSDRGAPMNNKVADYEMLASHGAELSYLWPDTGKRQELSERFTDKQVAFGSQMRRYWARFAQNKNPNSQILPKWEDFHRKGSIMVLEPDKLHNVPASRIEEAHKCSFWDSIPRVMDRGEVLPAKEVDKAP